LHNILKTFFITDHHIVASLCLQAAFGLRKEESIKFIVRYADQGDHIRLKASGAKVGKPEQYLYAI